MVSIAKIMDTSFDLSNHNLYDLLKDDGYEFPADDDPEDDIDYVYEVDEDDDLKLKTHLHLKNSLTVSRERMATSGVKNQNIDEDVLLP